MTTPHEHSHSHADGEGGVPLESHDLDRLDHPGMPAGTGRHTLHDHELGAASIPADDELSHPGMPVGTGRHDHHDGERSGPLVDHPGAPVGTGRHMDDDGHPNLRDTHVDLDEDGGRL